VSGVFPIDRDTVKTGKPATPPGTVSRMTQLGASYLLMASWETTDGGFCPQPEGTGHRATILAAERDTG
jgi:hypothetical protein